MDMSEAIIRIIGWAATHREVWCKGNKSAEEKFDEAFAELMELIYSRTTKEELVDSMKKMTELRNAAA